MAVDVREAHVAPVESHRRPRVVEAEEVEHRRVEVVDLDAVLDGVEAELVGRAVDRAALDPAAP